MDSKGFHCWKSHQHIELLSERVKSTKSLCSLGGFFVQFSVSFLPPPTHLHSQDSKNNKKGTADDHNVANGLQRRHQCLHHQLQTWSSADHTKTQQKRYVRDSMLTEETPLTPSPCMHTHLCDIAI